MLKAAFMRDSEQTIPVGSRNRRKTHLRRWSVSACMLILVTLLLAPLFYSWRPLSIHEQAFAGTWRNTTVNKIYCLSSDRRVLIRGEPICRWYVKDGNLIFTDESLQDWIQRIVNRWPLFSMVPTFKSDGSVSFFAPQNGATFEWQRID